MVPVDCVNCYVYYVNVHFHRKKCIGINDLFREAFGVENYIVKIVKCKTKCACLINYYIAPYFVERH